MTETSGWHPDPFGRFEFRYHNGERWTGDVATAGLRSVDQPIGVATPPTGRGSGDRAATTAFVLGIIGVCVAWLPVLVAIGALASVGALIAARRARTRAVASPRRAGQMRAGRILGIIGLVLVIPGLVLTRALFGVLNPGPYSVEVTGCEANAGRAVLTGSITNLSSSSRGYLILVRFTREGTSSILADQMVQIDDVAAGDDETFVTSISTDVEAIACDILDVLGGLPINVT